MIAPCPERQVSDQAGKARFKSQGQSVPDRTSEPPLQEEQFNFDSRHDGKPQPFNRPLG